MTRGAALPSCLQAENITPYSAEREARIEQFLWTRQQWAAHLSAARQAPNDGGGFHGDRSGVMVVHGSPQDSLVALSEELSNEQMEEATNCIAEDVLVVGMTHRAFVRKQDRLLVINAGSIGDRFGPQRTEHSAHVTLLQGYDDLTVRAYAYNIRVGDESLHGYTFTNAKGGLMKSFFSFPACRQR